MSTSASAPGRAVIYARVSSDRAGGRSVEEQVSECRTECERHAWPVADVLVDNDVSASRYATKDRPEYARLQALLQPGDVLVMWEASRAQRDLKRYVELRDLCARRGVRWSYSGRLYDLSDGDDRFSTGLDALLAEKEAEQTRTRILRAHRANLADGKPHGRVPYGYRIIRDPETGKPVRREPHPGQAPLIAEAARRVLAGQSFASVVRWIAEQDNSLRWDAAKLRRLLINPTLAGFRVHTEVKDGVRGPRMIHGRGTWEPILTEDQHNDLVALFAARQSGPRGVPVKYLVSGIAECGVCGEKVWRGRGGTKKDGSRYEVYTCRPGRHAARRLDLVDEAVHEVVEQILTSPAVLAALAETPEADTTAPARLAELRARLDAVETEIIEGRMPASTGARAATRLEALIAEAEAAAAPVFTDPAVRSLATAADPVAEWRGMPLADQREFIKATLHIRIERIGRGRWHDKRAGITIEPQRR
ncbi:recombinase family protein [Tsukamurella spumae]|uniref:Recombinase family protein n=1 Tax=Tsukamurella spumae TaxID=44753 RepID=A0A846X1E7_9ACTN|nr:recombinase family protein [Tsukamurella spumae]NKY18159.1 recombinase family protein [Tsukamurella spumae]